MPLFFLVLLAGRCVEGLGMDKKQHAQEGKGSRAGAIIYIVVSVLSILFFYWFGNIGSGGYAH